MIADRECPNSEGTQQLLKEVTMSHQKPSIVTEELKTDQGEEESLVQWEFSIVITALVTLFITLGYFMFNSR